MNRISMASVLFLLAILSCVGLACESGGSNQYGLDSGVNGDAGDNGDSVDTGENGNGEEQGIGIEIVDGDAEKEGDYLSMQIAVDKDGGIHGVYHYTVVGGDNELLYVSRAHGGEWVTEMISPLEDSVQQERADIGVDGQGAVHIILGTATPRAIWHAEKAGSGDWLYTKIADLPNSPNHLSLFIDGQDHLHVGYSVNTDDYRYAYRELNREWQDEPIYSAVNAGYSIDLVVDQDEVIHVLHHSQRSMFYLSRHMTDTQWSEAVELVDGLSSTGASVSLGMSLDGDGLVHAFFNDGQSADNTRYTRKALEGEFSEIPLGLPRTAYTNRGICSPDDGGAFITFQPFSNWSMSAVFIDSEGAVSAPFVIDNHSDLRMGAHSSCTVDSAGNLHLLYNQSTLENKALKYAFVPKLLLP